MMLILPAPRKVRTVIGRRNAASLRPSDRLRRRSTSAIASSTSSASLLPAQPSLISSPTCDLSLFDVVSFGLVAFRCVSVSFVAVSLCSLCSCHCTCVLQLMRAGRTDAAGRRDDTAPEGEAPLLHDFRRPRLRRRVLWRYVFDSPASFSLSLCSCARDCVRSMACMWTCAGRYICVHLAVLGA